MPVYLDNSATTRVCEEAVNKMTDVMLHHYGNPSSLHAMGLDAEDIVAAARKNIAEALRCKPAEILFTSGGTEANNLAVFGAARALQRRGRRIVTTAIEHPSVLNAMRELEKAGFEVVYLTPGADGAVKTDELYRAVTQDTVLVSMMLVNNETGVIQPVAEAKKAVLRAKSPALVHCDAVQAFCKVPLRVDKLGVDLLTMSAHKIHGPKGAGALYIRHGARILPLLFGGGQENGLRSGTEAVPAIAGFGEAARIANEKLPEFIEITSSLRAYCAEQFGKMPGVTVNFPPAVSSSARQDDSIKSPSVSTAGFPVVTSAEGATDVAASFYTYAGTSAEGGLLAAGAAEGGLPTAGAHIMNISVEGIRSETMLHYLESKEIYVSSGSACSKGAKSHVLGAMGLPDKIIDSSLRISFSRYNTLDDAKALVEAVASGAATLMKR